MYLYKLSLEYRLNNDSEYEFIYILFYKFFYDILL